MTPLRTMRPDEATALLDRHRGLFHDEPRQRAAALAVPLGFAAFTAFAIWWLDIPFRQIGAGLASKLGSLLRLRRNDMRMLVGCGAGGAIGAAFGAPLTGAFYAFELIVGTYTVQSAAPILVASLAGVAWPAAAAWLVAVIAGVFMGGVLLGGWLMAAGTV